MPTLAAPKHPLAADNRWWAILQWFAQKSSLGVSYSAPTDTLNLGLLLDQNVSIHSVLGHAVSIFAQARVGFQASFDSTSS